MRFLQTIFSMSSVLNRYKNFWTYRYSCDSCGFCVIQCGSHTLLFDIQILGKQSNDFYHPGSWNDSPSCRVGSSCLHHVSLRLAGRCPRWTGSRDGRSKRRGTAGMVTVATWWIWATVTYWWTKMTESRYFGETLYITLLCFSNFSRFYNRRCGVHLSHFLDVL